MKKLILPVLTASVLFANNIDNKLDNIIVELNNHNYNKVIQELKKLPENKQINFLLGKAYFEKHLTYSNYETAFKYFKKAKTPNSYYYLGKMYQNGLGVKENISEAIRYYKLADTKEAKFELAKLYIDGKYVLKTHKLGLKLLKDSAKSGYDKAQFFLGKLYLEDNSIVSKDLEEAAKWLYMSAHNNNFKEAKELWDKYNLDNLNKY
jgi:TPR repeat protein